VLNFGLFLFKESPRYKTPAISQATRPGRRKLKREKTYMVRIRTWMPVKMALAKRSLK
jgi:hypothetical protein